VYLTTRRSTSLKVQ